MINQNPIILPRGCGLPQVNKSYAVVDVKDGKVAGVPVWAFAICPTMPLPDDFDLAKQGMELRPRQKYVLNPDMSTSIVTEKNREGKDIYDVWDWVGENNYPNAMDWLEEVMKLGFHQLVQRTLRFDLLTPESNYYAVHAHAGIKNSEQYWLNLKDRNCPKDNPDHMAISTAAYDQTCHRILYNALIDGEPEKDSDIVTRKMPAFQYSGKAVMPDTEFYPAAFFKLPIGRLAYWKIYQDKQADPQQLALKALEALDQRLQTVKIVPIS